MSIFRKQNHPTIDPIPSDRIRLNTKQATTLIGPLTTLKADVTGQGNITIAGTFSGSLKITGDLDILEQANVEGEIEADNILIKGRINGKITAAKIELLKTAHVKADIKSKIMAVEAGAILNGKCETQSADGNILPEKSEQPNLDF